MIDLIEKRYKFAGDIFNELLKAGWDSETAKSFINNIPDADAVEVVHGEWLSTKDDDKKKM